MRTSKIGSKPNSTRSLDTREERVAFRFSQKRGLTIPFDIENLAKSLAVIEEKTFPVEIDGLCLDVKGRSGRPRIWIKKHLREKRRNFTLAHEIGHIIIPWHTGSIVDDLDVENSTESSYYIDMEREANRFAAELLMPFHWASSIAKRADHMQNAMRAIYDVANVSGQAAALRTIQTGPPGYIVSAVRDNLIEWSMKTAGTITRLPRRQESVTNVAMATHFPPEVLLIGNTQYYWWKEREKIQVPEKPSDEWRDILEAIVERFSEDKRPKLKQRVNAIIGGALRLHPKGSSVESMYWSVLKSLENRGDHDPWLSATLSDPRFIQYVMARLYERSEQI